MKNIQQQNISISREEPILGYLIKKLLRQDPKNQGKNINEELAKIEDAANDIANSNNPKFNKKMDALLKNYSQEELNELLINFFEDLTDEPLSEREQVAKTNDFLINFGLQIRQKIDGTSEIILI